MTIPTPDIDALEAEAQKKSGFASLPTWQKTAAIAVGILVVVALASGNDSTSDPDGSPSADPVTASENVGASADPWESQPTENHVFYMTLVASGYFPEFIDYEPGLSAEADNAFGAMADSARAMIDAADDLMAIDDSCETFGLAAAIAIDTFGWGAGKAGAYMGAAAGAFKPDSTFLAAADRCA